VLGQGGKNKLNVRICKLDSVRLIGGNKQKKKKKKTNLKKKKKIRLVRGRTNKEGRPKAANEGGEGGISSRSDMSELANPKEGKERINAYN